MDLVADVVHVLDDVVIDQIAAGEVVERPASVVKELVENALDAGAGAITVDVEGGGRRLIRVVDDGCGMSPADARRALGRHATSKLRATDDLWTLTTMGFRGEALPSIAAVSKLTLTTRRRDDLAAVRLSVDGGGEPEVTAAGAPAGTCVEVRELLANVPARLKFLKGDATESSHVTEVVARLAMTHPRVHFRLRQGGRTALELPPSSAVDRVRAVVGGRVGEALHEVHGEDAGLRVTAYLGAPDLAQATARGVQLFVGRRFVRDRNLLHAVTMGYGELVPRGRYPVAVVMIDVPGALVDVNVHPQKLEVRFSDGPAVATAVRHVVRRGLAAAPWAELTATASVQMHAVASMGPPRMAMASDLATRYADTTTRALFPIGGVQRAAVQGALGLRAPEAIPAPVRAAEGSTPSGWASSVRAKIDERAREAAQDARAASQPAPTFFGRLRYLGQLDRTYLVCEADGELVLLDQHVAHERVEVHRLRERATGGASVQRLLFPQTMALPNAASIEGAAEVLAAVGFEVEPFGGDTIAIKAIPAGLRTDATELLRDLLADLDKLDDRLDHVLATVACHSVVRAGDPLSPREAEALLAQMDGVDFEKTGLHHARPVLLRIGISEIARRFGR